MATESNGKQWTVERHGVTVEEQAALLGAASSVAAPRIALHVEDAPRDDEGDHDDGALHPPSRVRGHVSVAELLAVPVDDDGVQRSASALGGRLWGEDDEAEADGISPVLKRLTSSWLPAVSPRRSPSSSALAEMQQMPPPLPPVGATERAQSTEPGLMAMAQARDAEFDADADAVHTADPLGARCRTGADVVAYFGRWGEHAATTTFYLNRDHDQPARRIFDPYQLRVVAADKREREHFIMTARGVFLCAGGSDSVFFSLSEWARMSSQHRVLTQIPFFKRFWLTKMFARWRVFLKQKRYRLMRARFVQRSFVNQREIFFLLSRIQEQCCKVWDEALFLLPKGQGGGLATLPRIDSMTLLIGRHKDAHEAAVLAADASVTDMRSHGSQQSTPAISRAASKVVVGDADGDEEDDGGRLQGVSSTLSLAPSSFGLPGLGEGGVRANAGHISVEDLEHTQFLQRKRAVKNLEAIVRTINKIVSDGCRFITREIMRVRYQQEHDKKLAKACDIAFRRTGIHPEVEKVLDDERAELEFLPLTVDRIRRLTTASWSETTHGRFLRLANNMLVETLVEYALTATDLLYHRFGRPASQRVSLVALPVVFDSTFQLATEHDCTAVMDLVRRLQSEMLFTLSSMPSLLHVRNVLPYLEAGGFGTHADEAGSAVGGAQGQLMAVQQRLRQVQDVQSIVVSMPRYEATWEAIDLMLPLDFVKAEEVLAGAGRLVRIGRTLLTFDRETFAETSLQLTGDDFKKLITEASQWATYLERLRVGTACGVVQVNMKRLKTQLMEMNASYVDSVKSRVQQIMAELTGRYLGEMQTNMKKLERTPASLEDYATYVHLHTDLVRQFAPQMVEAVASVQDLSVLCSSTALPISTMLKVKLDDLPVVQLRFQKLLRRKERAVVDSLADSFSVKLAVKQSKLKDAIGAVWTNLTTPGAYDDPSLASEPVLARIKSLGQRLEALREKCVRIRAIQTHLDVPLQDMEQLEACERMVEMVGDIWAVWSAWRADVSAWQDEPVLRLEAESMYRTYLVHTRESQRVASVHGEHAVIAALAADVLLWRARLPLVMALVSGVMTDAYWERVMRLLAADAWNADQAITLRQLDEMGLYNHAGDAASIVNAAHADARATKRRQGNTSVAAIAGAVERGTTNEIRVDGKQRVLLVLSDDQAGLQSLLGSVGLTNVHVVGSAKEALAALGKDAFDLVFLAIHLDAMSTMRRLRGLESTAKSPAVPVIGLWNGRVDACDDLENAVQLAKRKDASAVPAVHELLRKICSGVHMNAVLELPVRRRELVHSLVRFVPGIERR